MTETICAVSTPHGRGGIGVIRVSGDKVKTIAAELLGRVPQPRMATLSQFTNADGESIDSGLAIFFPAPNSFTGEDVLELQGHGNPVLHALLMERLFALGARLAHPGEFSERAFLNERMDLAQAEAVMDLVTSASRQAAQAALRSLQGGFSKQVLDLDRKVLNLRMYIEGAIDFVEEEIDFLADSDQRQQLDTVVCEISDLIEKCEHGRQIQDGYQLVIAGEPNVGKSSLFNALLNEERAIVTHIAGTTRDTIDAVISLDGLPITLIDTAGLHSTNDPVEAAGIERTESALTGSDLILWITDDARGNQPETAMPEGVSLVVRNKCDLSEGETGRREDDSIGISAKIGSGLPELKTAIQEICEFEPRDDAFAGRPRHLLALSKARDALRDSVELLNEKQGDLVAENLRHVQHELGTIVGVTTSDDLLGEIFSNFCIGK